MAPHERELLDSREHSLTREELIDHALKAGVSRPAAECAARAPAATPEQLAIVAQVFAQAAAQRQAVARKEAGDDAE